jgi:hypothetical protein
MFGADAIERHLQLFRVKKNDPVACRRRLIGTAVDSKLSHLVEHVVSCAGNRRDGALATLEKAAIGKDLGIRRGSAEKAVFLDETDFGARLGGSYRGAHPTGATAGDDDVVVRLGTAAVQFLHDKDFLSADRTVKPTRRIGMGKIITPAIDDSVASRFPAGRRYI